MNPRKARADPQKEPKIVSRYTALNAYDPKGRRIIYGRCLVFNVRLAMAIVIVFKVEQCNHECVIRAALFWAPPKRIIVVSGP